MLKSPVGNKFVFQQTRFSGSFRSSKRQFSFSAPQRANTVPERARVVIVGGGIIGCSVGYHLAHMGWKDVLIVERQQLTSGTTWHAAGLIETFGSTSETSTELRKYTRDLYARLEKETGLSTGWKEVGFIELAANEDRLEEYRRVAAFNRRCGVDVHEISPDEVKRHFPLCRTDDLLAGFYVKEDGRANPVDVTMSLAAGFRQQGGKIIEGVSATGVLRDLDRVVGITTDQGPIRAEYVVNCAGMWARQFGELAGVSIPLQAAEHYYLVTDAIPEVDKSWPVIEDPSSYTYIRPEGDGLMVGLFEPLAAAWNVERIPDNFSFGEITPDWERMLPFLTKAMDRVPRTHTAGTKTFFCGPESFTPDLSPIVGEAPELKNYFVAAGMNSIGILSGGGIGRLLAHWITTGKPDMDVTGMNIVRLQKYQKNPEYRRHRVTEALGMVYKCHYPGYAMQTARGVKHSPIHQRLKERRAYFRDVSGWESPKWYAPEGVEPKVDKLSWGRENWFPYWQAEHKACREGAVLIDMSFMAKFVVQGRDAGTFLSRLSTNHVNGSCGMITYTQWLDDDGKMQADVTVIKLSGPEHSAKNETREEGKFIVIATDTMLRHAENWMRRQLRDDEHVFIHDVTGAYAQINVQGPKSRSVLQAVTSEDMSGEAFPFRTAREIDIGYARAICTRITYVGELGYELFIPTEFALQVYDRLVQAGTPLGLVHAGLSALGSLRLEKGYRDYGHDMDNTDTFLEVGLGFTADYEKAGGFIGKEAVLCQKEGGTLKKRLLQILLKDPEPMMYHAEIVYRNGKRVGDIRVASYGHTLGAAVGLSMVEDQVPITNKYIAEGKWEVEIAGRMVPATASLQPMYDPKNEKIKL